MILRFKGKEMIVSHETKMLCKDFNIEKLDLENIWHSFLNVRKGEDRIQRAWIM